MLSDLFPAAAPVVSVCIANYNGSAWLRDCLQSVLQQASAPPFEILVHDDASSDDSAALVAREFPLVRLLRSETNVGFCVSNNRLVEAARGRFVLLLNNDAALYEDALSQLYEAACKFPDAILSLPQYDWETNSLVDQGCMLDIFSTPVPNRDPQTHDVAFVIGACLWVSTSVWRELGGLPLWMGSIAEDLHFCCQARLAGHPVRALAASGYRHRQGSSFGGNKLRENRISTTFRRRFLSERNRLMSALICIPNPAAWVLCGVMAGMLAFEGVLLTLVKMDRRYWTKIYQPAFLDTFRSRDLISRERLTVQSRRKISVKQFFTPYRLLPRKVEMLFLHGFPRTEEH